MAGVLQPNLTLAVGPTVTLDFGAPGVIPAGKAESCCLMACLQSGTADCYVHVYDWISAGASLILQGEPVRYRVPGGSPVLLQDYIVTADAHLICYNSGPGTVNFILYNRWRFDV